MKSWASVSRGLMATLAALLLAGCFPTVPAPGEEEKEPHFIAGKNRVTTLDFDGAVECFQKALEVNPRSAAAHFELACLYDQKVPDPAAAIYHYRSYLRLRPDAGNADIVKERIRICKQSLAQEVSLGPLTARQQREVEQTAEDNKKLTDQVKTLQAEVDKWRAYAASLKSYTNTVIASTPTPRSNQAAAPRPSTPERLPASASDSTQLSANSVITSRTHTVKSGETLSAIARQYGVKLTALQTANPRVDPRRLQVGQSLVIPVP